MTHLLTTAPGLPALLAELRAAAEKRLTTPTSQMVCVPSAHLQSEADAIASDLEIHRWKVGGGPVREHDERAVAIERGSRRFT